MILAASLLLCGVDSLLQRRRKLGRRLLAPSPSSASGLRDPSQNAPPRSTVSRVIFWSIVLVLLGSWIWTWLFRDRINEMLRIYAINIVGLVAMLVWVLVLSGWSWRQKLLRLTLFFGSLTLLLVLLLRIYRVDGFDADLWPQLSFRSQPPKSALSPQATARPTIIPEERFQKREGDFHQYRGPQRDGVYHPGPALADRDGSFTFEPLWRQPLGAGWSGFSAQGDVIVTQAVVGSTECIVACNAETGKVYWSLPTGEPFQSAISGIGPRATPTIADGRVYAMTGSGNLVCADLRSGQSIWTKSCLTKDEPESENEGISCSPLVWQETVYVSAGSTKGTLTAFDAATGEIRWRAGHAKVSYSSPMLVEMAQRQIVLLFRFAGLTGFDPKTGEILFDYEWKTFHANSTSQPVLIPTDRVLLSNDYNTILLQITRDQDKWSVQPVWENRNLKTRFSNAIYLDGSIVGLDLGILTILDPESGKRLWKRGRYGHGHVTGVGSMALVTTDDGNLSLIKPTADGPIEIAKTKALDGKSWNVPSVASGRVFWRDATEAVCYRIRPNQGTEDSRPAQAPSTASANE